MELCLEPSGKAGSPFESGHSTRAAGPSPAKDKWE
jgi:hypothetical protein